MTEPTTEPTQAEATATTPAPEGQESPAESGWLRFDRLVDGRRTRLLIGAAATQAVFAPAIDRTLATLKDSPTLGETARELSSVSFAGFAAISLLSSLTTLALCIGMLGGRASALASSHENGGVGGLWAEAFTFIHTEWSILTNQSVLRAWGTVAGASYVAMVTLRDVARIFRFLMWEGPISWFGLEDTFVATPLVWLYEFENILELSTLVTAVLGLCALAFWLMAPVRPTQNSQVLTGRTASSLTRTIDVTDRAAVDRVARAFHGDLVVRVLRALGEWKASAELGSEADLQRSLAAHLGGQGFGVRTEAWIGARSRADIVIDEAVVLELKFGKIGQSGIQRLDGQVRQYAGLWPGRGPLMVVCVGIPDDRLREWARSAASWNRQLADVEADDNGLPAPILVLEQVGKAGDPELEVDG